MLGVTGYMRRYETLTLRLTRGYKNVRRDRMHTDNADRAATRDAKGTKPRTKGLKRAREVQREQD